jgi:hypothetical protein
VYVQPFAPHCAPWLLPDVVSQVTPHAVQLLVVFSGVHWPLQHPLPVGQPWPTSHPGRHRLFWHVSPSAQLLSVTHSTHEWFCVSQMGPPLPATPPSPPASPPASAPPPSRPPSAVQSALVLQPGTQDVPAQYCAVGHDGFEGVHCTHVSFIESHQGVGT